MIPDRRVLPALLILLANTDLRPIIRRVGEIGAVGLWESAVFDSPE
jgi:hypothetical protein